MDDFDHVIRTLNNIPQSIDTATERGLKEAGNLVVRTAKKKLGKYQQASAGYPSWPKLKPLTVRRKYSKNADASKRFIKKHGSWLNNGGNDDAPLVDTGHLRQAITIDTSAIHDGIIYVGVATGEKNEQGSAPGKYAAAHEFGYAKGNIPPRPFLRPAAYENIDNIQEVLKRTISEEVLDAWK